MYRRLLILLSVGTLWLGFANIALANPKILEALPNPVGTDSSGEYIVIQNTGEGILDFSNWEFNGKSLGTNDSATNTLEPNNFLVVHDDNFEFPQELIEADMQTIAISSLGLSNSGEILELLDSEGTVLDTFEYESTKEGTPNIRLFGECNQTFLLSNLKEAEQNQKAFGSNQVSLGKFYQTLHIPQIAVSETESELTLTIPSCSFLQNSISYSFATNPATSLNSISSQTTDSGLEFTIPNQETNLFRIFLEDLGLSREFEIAGSTNSSETSGGSDNSNQNSSDNSEPEEQPTPTPAPPTPEPTPDPSDNSDNSSGEGQESSENSGEETSTESDSDSDQNSGESTEENVSEEPESLLGRLIISEIYPSPSDGPEWLELQNISDSEISEITIGIKDRTSSIKEVTLGAIGAGEFAILEDANLPISLNNSGDLVEIYQASTLLDSVEYGSLNSTKSFAKNSSTSEFEITSRITKNQANLFDSEDSDDENQDSRDDSDQSSDDPESNEEDSNTEPDSGTSDNLVSLEEIKQLPIRSDVEISLKLTTDVGQVAKNVAYATDGESSIRLKFRTALDFNAPSHTERLFVGDIRESKGEKYIFVKEIKDSSNSLSGLEVVELETSSDLNQNIGEFVEFEAQVLKKHKKSAVVVFQGEELRIYKKYSEDWDLKNLDTIKVTGILSKNSSAAQPFRIYLVDSTNLEVLNSPSLQTKDIDKQTIYTETGHTLTKTVTRTYSDGSTITKNVVKRYEIDEETQTKVLKETIRKKQITLNTATSLGVASSLGLAESAVKSKHVWEVIKQVRTFAW